MADISDKDRFYADLIKMLDYRLEEELTDEFYKFVGSIADKRNGKWPELQKLLKGWMSSDDVSHSQKALKLIRCSKWPTFTYLLIESIYGPDPNLRINAMKGLCTAINDGFDVDKNTLMNMICHVIKYAEKGCCAFSGVINCHAVMNGHREMKCNQEHSAALELIYSMAHNMQNKNICNDNVERIMRVCTETILDSHCCTKDISHRTALKLLTMLIDHHHQLVPSLLLNDIVTCCIVSIAHDIENEDEWAAFDPSQKDDFNSWPQMWSSSFITTIVTKIGWDKIGDVIVEATRDFLNYDNWKIRFSVFMIWWSVNGRIMKGRLSFLINCTMNVAYDEHPQVRDVMVRLMGYTFGRFSGVSIDEHQFDLDRLAQLMSSLVFLTSDSIPRVRATAMKMLCSFEFSTALFVPHYTVLLPRLLSVLDGCPINNLKNVHVHSLGIIALLARGVGKARFMLDIQAINPVLCPIAALVNDRHKYFGALRRPLVDIIDVLGSSELSRSLY